MNRNRRVDPDLRKWQDEYAAGEAAAEQSQSGETAPAPEEDKEGADDGK